MGIFIKIYGIYIYIYISILVFPNDWYIEDIYIYIWWYNGNINGDIFCDILGHGSGI